MAGGERNTARNGIFISKEVHPVYDSGTFDLILILLLPEDRTFVDLRIQFRDIHLKWDDLKIIIKPNPSLRYFDKDCVATRNLKDGDLFRLFCTETHPHPSPSPSLLNFRVSVYSILSATGFLKPSKKLPKRVRSNQFWGQGEGDADVGVMDAPAARPERKIRKAAQKAHPVLQEHRVGNRMKPIKNKSDSEESDEEPDFGG